MSMPAPKVAPIAIKGQHRKDDDLEAWICARLNLRDLFAGMTSRETRRDRLKVVLLERGLIEAIAGRLENKPITWRQLFHKLYSEEI